MDIRCDIELSMQFLGHDSVTDSKERFRSHGETVSSRDLAWITRKHVVDPLYIFVSVKFPEPVHPDCAPVKIQVPEMVLLFTLP
jgi:hypothetical protein